MAKTKKRSKRSKAGGGLAVKTYKGLNKKRMKKGTGGPGKRVVMRNGDTVPVQFLQKPEDFIEFEIHNFQEDGRWEYVPCVGDDCPLCDDDSETRSRTRYRFCCNVYNLKEKRVQVLEGPKDMAGRIYYRYERSPSKFLKRAYDVTKFPTQPTSYAVDIAEDADPVSVKGKELIDLEEYLVDELKRYYGDELPTGGSSSALDDDFEDLDDDDFEDDEFELDDEDDEDEDFEEDDDSEDEEDDDDLDLDDDDLEDWDDEDEDDDEEEDEDDEEEYDLETLDLKELKTLAKLHGVKIEKGKRASTYRKELAKKLG